MTWDDIDKLQDKYHDKFDDSFPTAPFMGKTLDEIADMINKCLSENKDAYEIGFLSEEDIY